jgi:hypothetical protein
MRGREGRKKEGDNSITKWNRSRGRDGNKPVGGRGFT